MENEIKIGDHVEFTRVLRHVYSDFGGDYVDQEQFTDIAVVLNFHPENNKKYEVRSLTDNKVLRIRKCKLTTLEQENGVVTNREMKEFQYLKEHFQSLNYNEFDRLLTLRDKYKH